MRRIYEFLSVRIHIIRQKRFNDETDYGGLPAVRCCFAADIALEGILVNHRPNCWV